MGKIKKYNNHNYDTSWDLMESNKGYFPIHENAFEKNTGNGKQETGRYG
jgi:hypothetical protein